MGFRRGARNHEVPRHSFSRLKRRARARKPKLRQELGTDESVEDRRWRAADEHADLCYRGSHWCPPSIGQLRLATTGGATLFLERGERLYTKERAKRLHHKAPSLKGDIR